MERNKHFPNVWSALLILVFLVALQIIIAVIAYEVGYVYQAGDPKAIGLITVLSCGIMFTLLMGYKGLGYRELFNPSSNSFVSIIVVLFIPLLLVMGGAVFWIAELTRLIVSLAPLDDSEIAVVQRILDGGFVSVVTICIIAPLAEEMLFRGIFLRSFLVNYSTNRAICLSALLFALFHMNIYQIPTAFILGCIFGWLYVRTRSLWPCILGHSLYNTCVVVIWSSIDKSEQALAQSAGSSTVMISVMAAALSALGVVWLSNILKPAVSDSRHRED